ncbi:TetR family transcriptional regulator [Streptomyces sp. 1114.5]|uniref:TetR/AcrR family transcriptional regulator n=1 Tax=Streptomyces sp. 1114.5 TaxID=1938830 RepID=UPI000F171096|nr:TetR/AcrR family transcriptional regulator C-terminal domain-containing protein [Streptomyces sp. 1114.5]RKT18997.1 TetR family transcriptional regulator [Streptomyces sp. 1114.5]
MPSSKPSPSGKPGPSGPSNEPRPSSPSARPTPPEAPELIWLRPERTGRGPRPAHSRESIAAAAIAIADAEGLDAASMRRVAAALGAGTMSLYNYVPKKEHLLDLMLDAVIGEYRLPAEPSGDVRADLTRLAHEQLAILRRHPWVPAVVLARPGIGPNALRYTDHFLAVTAPTGLDGAARMEAMSLFNGFLTQYAQYEQTAAAGAKWQAELVGYLTQAATSGEYPHLAQAFATSGPPADPDRTFDRVLERVISAVLASAAGH